MFLMWYLCTIMMRGGWHMGKLLVLLFLQFDNALISHRYALLLYVGLDNFCVKPRFHPAGVRWNLGLTNKNPALIYVNSSTLFSILSPLTCIHLRTHCPEITEWYITSWFTNVSFDSNLVFFFCTDVWFYWHYSVHMKTFILLFASLFYHQFFYGCGIVHITFHSDMTLLKLFLSFMLSQNMFYMKWNLIKLKIWRLAHHGIWFFIQ